MSLLIVGTVAFDSIQTPFGSVNKTLGGSATYIGIASSYFNNSSNLISVVGEDFLKKDITLLMNHKINCEGLKVFKNEKTFFWSGRYHKNMNNRDTLETQLNVLKKFNPKVPTNYQDCKYLMLANLMPSIQLKTIQQLNVRPKLVVTDTMNYWIENSLMDLHNVIGKTDVLIINEEEALQLTKKQNIINAATTIQKFGPKFIIIKRGEEGAILFYQNMQFECPAYTVKKCVDPTGAGDTFAGAFIGHLNSVDNISFHTMKDAVINASAMASFCVENFGVQNIINISNKSLELRINSLKNRI